MEPAASHKIGQPHVTSRDMLRLYRAWAGFGQAMIARPAALTWQAGERMADGVAGGLMGPWNPEAVATGLLRAYADLARDLLAVPSAAAGVAVARFDAPDTTAMDAALSGSAPASALVGVAIDHAIAERQRRDLAGRAGHDPDDPVLHVPAMTSDAPFLLPARVLDASQAWAAWFIPVATARDLMQDACRLGHHPPEMLDAFEPVSVGAGAAMVTLLASDYRASDFGVTQEIGLTLTVTPRGGEFPDPGQLFLRLVVTDKYSLAAARQIWGIRKDFWNNAAARTPMARLETAYAEDRVRVGLGTRLPGAGRGALRVTFPRVGTGQSHDMPGLIYSMVEPHGMSAAPLVPARALLRRSGQGEGMQIGGAVAIDLPADRAAGQAAGCLCAGKMACLCDTLRALGLDRRRPAANGWTERMTCTLAEPVPVSPQPDGKSPL